MEMPEQHVDGEFTEVTLVFYDGSQRTIRLIDEEVPYPDGRLIVSRTDLHGVITQCNQSFVLMSGYTEAELVGQQHCILRHPDMPAAAFQDLWLTIERGEPWHGYVKNLRKDGRYYWVFASVIPNKREGRIVSYTSVRRKPSRTKIRDAESLYRKMLDEQS
ncbi:MAG: PAS domain-containing protein [Gammaproteobacteria bacterium]|nr:PAS domain-containing protein [Gammaproteobacteria bacterium]